MRYLIRLSYHGGPFSGWQVQPGEITVQGELNRCLSALVGDEIHVVGAGRTDTGVHASCMFAHFDHSTELDTDQIVFRLNRFLPESIAIEWMRRVEEETHARFSAISRTYHYFIHPQKDPFLVDRSYHLEVNLNLEDMNKAARSLLGHHDFSCFSKSHTQTKTNFCRVEEASWEVIDGQFRFTIKADRFLRNMVRAIVGSLLEVGSGKQSISYISELMGSGDRKLAGQSVPAHGLFLVDVEYPERVIKSIV